MKKLLFLCTGNYYRSRFAELYFRKLARDQNLDWKVDSRGLRPSKNNEGPFSPFTAEACLQLGIEMDPLRFPIKVSQFDFQSSDLVVAVKETEHRPMIRERFADWENRIRYWEIHDIDCAPPEESLPELRLRIDELAVEFRLEVDEELSHGR